VVRGLGENRAEHIWIGLRIVPADQKDEREREGQRERERDGGKEGWLI